jgi:Arc/MetJ-type ribon-helix-helix transcriptional regulator
MRRTQIYLDENQKAALRVVAADRGVNVSELVREAIQEFLRVELNAQGRVARFDALREIILAELDGGLTDEEIDAVAKRKRPRYRAMPLEKTL